MIDLPTSWTSVSVAEVAEVQGGIQKQPKRRPDKNRYPFLRVANVLRGRLDLSEVHEIELFDKEPDRYLLRFGDLLVVEGNGSAEQIGRAAMWREEIRDCTHQNHLIRVRPSSAILPNYLALAWNSPEVADQLRRVASSTSGLHTLSTAKLKSIEIPLPPIAEQERVVAVLEGHLSRLDAALRQITASGRRAAALRSSLLSQAFRGQLVTQDPGDEPAGRLLERVQQELAATRPVRTTGRAAKKSSLNALPTHSDTAARGDAEIQGGTLW